MTNLARLPVKEAKLPAVYEQAQEALATCYRIDECKDWANRAEAIASYARQSEDETLLQTAMRIRARAIKRVGELIKEIEEAAPGVKPRLGMGAPPQLHGGRGKAARDAGLSRHQAKQATRVASVPDEVFEDLVERPGRPATLTQLAKKGTKPAPFRKRDPRAAEDVRASVRGNGALRDFVKHVDGLDVRSVVRGTLPSERRELARKLVAAIAWLKRLQAAQKKGRNKK